jgi:L-seryl-tRNA(Ser) seleniumtransferase
MAQSGAILVEVGTTNRTHLKDYEQAISDNTAAILIAHHSNYKIIGFTSEPTVQELATLAHNHQLPLLYDQGSGALLDTELFGMEHEPTIQDGLNDGVDVLCFSGDKLVGGPQAGILCGRAGLIAKMKRHPLARAVRTDKMCLAALSVTLSRFLTGRAADEVPVWRMISRPIDEIELIAHDWAEFLSIKGLSAEVFAGNSTVGGGSLPGSTIPTRLVAVNHLSVAKLASNLRNHEPPVVARIMEDKLLLDPRTVLPGQEQQLLGAIVACS